MPTLKACASLTRRRVKPPTVRKFPVSQLVLGINKLRSGGCPSAQKAAIREHLCNYCQQMSRFIMSMDAITSANGASYGSGVRKLARPVTTSAFKSASVYLGNLPTGGITPGLRVIRRHRRRMSSPFQTYGSSLVFRAKAAHPTRRAPRRWLDERA